MNPHQQDERHAAAQAFMESLDQLGTSLAQPENGTTESDPQPVVEKAADKKQEQKPVNPISVRALEEAAADIERFMQAKEQAKEEGS